MPPLELGTGGDPSALRLRSTRVLSADDAPAFDLAGTRLAGVDHHHLTEWLYRGSPQTLPSHGIGCVAENLFRLEGAVPGFGELAHGPVRGPKDAAHILAAIDLHQELRICRAALGLAPTLIASAVGGSYGPFGNPSWSEGIWALTPKTGGIGKRMNYTRPPKHYLRAPEEDPATVETKNCVTGAPLTASEQIDYETSGIRLAGGRIVAQFRDEHFPNFNHNAWTNYPECVGGGGVATRWFVTEPSELWIFHNSITAMGQQFSDGTTPIPGGLFDLLFERDVPGPFGPGTAIVFPDWGGLGALVPWSACRDRLPSGDNASQLSGSAFGSDPGYENVLEQVQSGLLADYPLVLRFYLNNIVAAVTGSFGGGVRIPTGAINGYFWSGSPAGGWGDYGDNGSGGTEYRGMEPVPVVCDESPPGAAIRRESGLLRTTEAAAAVRRK